MDYPKPITRLCSGNKTDVALFVQDLLNTLKLDSAWIMIMSQGKLEDSFVCTATNISSEGTEKIKPSGTFEPVSTYRVDQAYLSLNDLSEEKENKERVDVV